MIIWKCLEVPLLPHIFARGGNTPSPLPSMDPSISLTPDRYHERLNLLPVICIPWSLCLTRVTLSISYDSNFLMMCTYTLDSTWSSPHHPTPNGHGRVRHTRRRPLHTVRSIFRPFCFWLSAKEVLCRPQSKALSSNESVEQILLRHKIRVLPSVTVFGRKGMWHTPACNSPIAQR